MPRTSKAAKAGATPTKKIPTEEEIQEILRRYKKNTTMPIKRPIEKHDDYITIEKIKKFNGVKKT